MKKPRPNRIAEQRKKKGLSQQQLADALNVHWTTISKLERGITHLNFDYAEEIAEILQTNVYDLLPQETALATVAISGFVNHGGDVEEIDEDQEHRVTINSSTFYDTETVWVSVRENALYPYFKNGDILGITWVPESNLIDKDGIADFSGVVGRFCLVRDNENRMFMGIVSLGTSRWMIDLHNANYPPLRDITPMDLGQVTVALMTFPAMRGPERGRET